MSSRLRIAVQSNGRLHTQSLAFLASLGLRFSREGRSILISCQEKDIDLLLVRDDDIPVYVQQGVADFGIVGKNVLYEVYPDADNIVQHLGFGFCKLVLAVPEKAPFQTIRDLEGERIATSYPKLVARFLKEQEIHAAIIVVTGSTEIAPEVNLADAICDITQTGRTLQEHKLRILHTLLESEAVLIQSPFLTQPKDIFYQMFYENPNQSGPLPRGPRQQTARETK